MSKTFWNWIVMLVAWFVFALLTFNFCVRDNCCTACDTTEDVAPGPPSTTTEVQRYPIDFQWKDPIAYTDERFDSLRTLLISGMGDNNNLVITGKYYASEPAPEGFGSMGLARAAQLRGLLAADIDTSRMTLTDLRLDDVESAQTGYFEGLSYDWREADAEEESEVVALSDTKIAIRFPYSSAVKEADKAVDDYLETLAQRLSQTAERVRLTGHTDNSGPDDSNMKLSERRAKFIRDILIRKGVAEDRISIEWKGESDPTSSNDTEEGRHNNRRVELEVLSGN